MSENVLEEIPQWQIDHPTWTFDRYAAGKKAGVTNKARYGLDYYERTGRAGGKISRGGYFSGPEGHQHAVDAGRRGGKASRRVKNV